MHLHSVVSLHACIFHIVLNVETVQFTAFTGF